jgi:periplasmic divalent cation tolerance protein
LVKLLASQASVTSFIRRREASASVWPCKVSLQTLFPPPNPFILAAEVTRRVSWDRLSVPPSGVQMAKNGAEEAGFYFLYITAASKEEATKLARALVEERLIACANVIDPIRSFYWWEGEVKDDSEAVIVAKTQGLQLEAAIRRVKEMSSHACPCVVAWPLTAGNPDFFEWVRKETGPDH